MKITYVSTEKKSHAGQQTLPLNRDPINQGPTVEQVVNEILSDDCEKRNFLFKLTKWRL